MARFSLAWIFVLMSAFCQDAVGKKPEMLPATGELYIEEFHELKIVCQSKGAKLQFSFPENTIMIPRSDHKILDPGDGTYTFLRSDAGVSDTGWYACAEEGIEIDNHFTNLNHTHEDISWIYVYVDHSSTDLFANNGYDFVVPKTIIVVAGSPVVVPCRPTSPSAYVKLWQNFKLLKKDEIVMFDPKIGFIMTQVAFEAGEATFHCMTYSHYDYYILRNSGPKPKMITVTDNELILQEGDELKIECYSETNFSFLFPNITLSNSSLQSKYEIFANKNGSKTFFRRSVISNDTGWYGCAGEGVQNNIPYYSINETRKEIDWIYVYVNSSVPITSGVMIYSEYYDYSPSVIIPFRPTSPGLHLNLFRWQHGVAEPVRELRFHPKIGFLLDANDTYREELFYCTTEEPVRHVSNNYSLDHKLLHYRQSVTPDADDSSVFENLMIHMTGDDLRMACEVYAPKIDLFYLEWIVPSTISKYRVQYNKTRSNGYFESNLYFKHENVLARIINISETDSGEYSCLIQDTIGGTRKVSRHVEVFDRNGERYIKLDKQGGAIHVTALEGETVKWLVDLVDFPSAEIEWYDSQGVAINGSNASNGLEHVISIVYQGAPQKLFIMSNLTLRDSGVYLLRAKIGNMSAPVTVTLNVQAPPIISIFVIHYQSFFRRQENIFASCEANGSPLPNITWSFLNLPKFPSRQHSTRVYLEKFDSASRIINGASHMTSYISLATNISGILTCEACNGLKCDTDTKTILFSASLEPYFTSTNLSHSSVTLTLERDKYQKLVLECYVSGKPYPEVTWFRDNIQIEEGSKLKFAYNNSELSIFFSGGDGGRYKCRAENENGHVEDYIDVTIEEKSIPDLLRLTISIIVAAIMLLVVIAILCLVVYKLRTKISREKSINESLKRFDEGALADLDPNVLVSDQAELLPYDMKWEFPRELLTLDKILGSGAFGIVRKAEAKSICRKEPVTTVAVKLVRSSATLNFITALTRELKILVYLGKHINVVNLLGACTKRVSYGELFVIVEYCRFGNLRDFLLRCRPSFVDQVHNGPEKIGDVRLGVDSINTDDGGPNSNANGSGNSSAAEDCSSKNEDFTCAGTNEANEDCVRDKNSGDAPLRKSKYQGDYTDMNLEPICTRDLVYWSWQVSRGMDYLGKRKVLHGDLAARNILLADNGIVKICDFGLSKALYEEAQYRNKGGDPLPVKWMAIESIKDRIFSFQSDVWSFGVVMWEFFTLGETPYPGIKSRELCQKLIDGHRMEKPKHSPSSIYDTMLDCWESDPARRPSFEKLADSFVDLLDEGFKSHYLEMSSLYMEIYSEMFNNTPKDYSTLLSPTCDAVSSSTVNEQIEMESLPHDESGNSV